MTQPDATISLSEPPESDQALAGLAKALAHPARIRIVRKLLATPSCIGCDLVNDIGLAQSTVSEHLRILKAAGVVVGEIERPRVCYSLNPASVAPLVALLAEINNCACAPASTDQGPCQT